jgi:hypothetical protein
MTYEHRIVGYETVSPGTLTGNRYNFRTHPKKQQDVVAGSLEELGWIDEVLVNLRSGEEWPDGERNVRTVIDGHLRVELAKTHGVDVPIKLVDLSPNEERIALALLDESTALAQRDVDTLSELLATLDPTNQMVADFFAELADEAGKYPEFEPIEDMTSQPEEVYSDETKIVIEVADYSKRVLAVTAIAELLKEHPEWEGKIAA